MENQNSNIPKLIIGTFVVFAMFIGYMVYQAFQSDVNLVHDDYYLQSTLHNKHIERIRRSENQDINLYYNRKIESIVFELPLDFNNVQGEISFYRPSDSKLDFIVPLNLENNKQFLNTNALIKGKWIVKANFIYNGESYFKESSFSK